MKTEKVHAGNYDYVLKNLSEKDYINSEYVVVYRCPVCGEVGVEYHQTLTVMENISINWSIEGGMLPTGLSLEPTTGVISGKPTKSEEFCFALTATNSFGISTIVTFSIIIHSNTELGEIQLGKALSAFVQSRKMQISGLTAGKHGVFIMPPAELYIKA